MTDVEKGLSDEKTKLKDGEKKDGPCCKPVASLVYLVFFIVLLVLTLVGFILWLVAKIFGLCCPCLCLDTLVDIAMWFIKAPFRIGGSLYDCIPF
mmetsp:Transcript_30795/g.67225  ORF Transcript_30795/g.67225 Transcript_30795/m.67225 type:complete len:95 (-) Transcript_30795:295-579(-)